MADAARRLSSNAASWTASSRNAPRSGRRRGGGTGGASYVWQRGGDGGWSFAAASRTGSTGGGGGSAAGAGALQGLLEAHACPAKRHDSKKTNLCAQLGIEASQQSLGRVGGKLAGHIGENRYVAGLAEDGRSKCQSILCRAYLAPGEPRIGKRAPSVRHGHSRKTKWYHIECIFASFRRTCKKSKTITSVADLEAFMQEQLERARPLVPHCTS